MKLSEDGRVPTFAVKGRVRLNKGGNREGFTFRAVK